ncbi:hypothetical protein NGM37_16860, partial [Streptomyces sp. TRM76130]|nr:hypothetical protein [Streptomyces sp. TRM76130]
MSQTGQTAQSVQTAQLVQTAQSAQPGQNAPTSPTLLLAEDDRAIRNALERALTLEGYRVVAVADGA